MKIVRSKCTILLKERDLYKSKAMASKQQTKLHSYIVEVNNTQIKFEFDDKRTMNSLIKAFEKAKCISIENGKGFTPPEVIKVETPKTFEGWSIVDKCDHIALRPPENTSKEEIKLHPTMSVDWSPEFNGQYWNDGMYHFFPRKTKLSSEFTKEDICENLKLLGAN
jgi:hypothetical protein